MALKDPCFKSCKRMHAIDFFYLSANQVPRYTTFTLSRPAFLSFVRPRDGGSEARMTKMKVSILDAKLESGSSSSFGAMTSQNFERKK